jgi:hypothetical protein
MVLELVELMHAFVKLFYNRFNIDMSEKAMTIELLREILKQKIAINMRERITRGWSISQVYAISLSQVRKLFNSDKKKDKMELLELYSKTLYGIQRISAFRKNAKK